jgi:type II secretory pathway component PulM
MYVYGTADAKDVKRLTKVCDDLHEFKTKMIHAAEQQLTYIRTLDEVTKQNVKNIVELNRALRDSIRNVSLKLNRVETDLLDTQEAISKRVKYSAAIR